MNLPGLDGELRGIWSEPSSASSSTSSTSTLGQQLLCSGGTSSVFYLDYRVKCTVDFKPSTSFFASPSSTSSSVSGVVVATPWMLSTLHRLTWIFTTTTHWMSNNDRRTVAMEECLAWTHSAPSSAPSNGATMEANAWGAPAMALVT